MTILQPGLPIQRLICQWIQGACTQILRKVILLQGHMTTMVTFSIRGVTTIRGPIIVTELIDRDVLGEWTLPLISECYWFLCSCCFQELRYPPTSILIFCGAPLSIVSLLGMDSVCGALERFVCSPCGGVVILYLSWVGYKGTQAGFLLLALDIYVSRRINLNNDRS